MHDAKPSWFSAVSQGEIYTEMIRTTLELKWSRASARYNRMLLKIFIVDFKRKSGNGARDTYLLLYLRRNL